MKEVRLVVHLARGMLNQWKAVCNRKLQQGKTVREAVQRWQPKRKITSNATSMQPFLVNNCVLVSVCAFGTLVVIS